VDRGERQQKYDDRANEKLKKYFDAVLVHTDPDFARLEESFQPSEPISIPVHYTGFVVSPEKTKIISDPPTRGIFVSAGGGIVGAPLFRAALDAQQDLWNEDKIPMTLVTGPFLPEPDLNDLKLKSKWLEGVEIIEFMPDFFTAMRKSLFSVSQCGYNTAMDILCAKIPSLVVPYDEGNESEQWDRAERLQKLGIIRVVRQRKLNGKTFAREIRSLMKFHPKPHNLNLNGTQNTLKVLQEVVADSTALSKAETLNAKEFSCNGDIA
jgi:predicted glycosyltransferase